MNKLPLALFSLRISIFVVMLMWTLDKFYNPAHAIAVYQKFYSVGGVNELVMTFIAGAEILLLIAFLFGIKRTFSYGLVFLLHGVSTFSAWPQYSQPFEGSNLLFFAAWPMLAACFTLFLFRDQDNLLNLQIRIK
jgi:hypothetical protein